MDSPVPIPDQEQPEVKKSRPQGAFLSAFKRFLREPRLNFLLLGLVLFVANAYIQRRRNLEELIDQVNELTIDVDVHNRNGHGDEKVKVRVFCE